MIHVEAHAAHIYIADGIVNQIACGFIPKAVFGWGTSTEPRMLFRGDIVIITKYGVSN